MRYIQMFLKWVESIYPGKRRNDESQQDQLYTVRPNSLLGEPQLHNALECNRFYQISILVAILLLISFYFIPFPINLILFIVSLVIFLVISYLMYSKSRSKTSMRTRQWSNAIYSPTTQTSGDLTLVDVPL
ncbi:unnamed protein product, partial [Medioppia subpectinata]